MTDLVEAGKAKAAGILSVLIGLTAFADLVCGAIYAAKGGPDGSGLWTGFGLALCAVLGLLTWWKRNKLAMVFFLVLDLLWFIVCVAGVIFTLFIWLLYHVFVVSHVSEAQCYMKDAKTCYCSRPGETDVTFDINCDDIGIIDHCLLGIVLLNAIGAILVLSGSIIGCMGTCCAQQNQTNVIVVEQSGMQPKH